MVNDKTNINVHRSNGNVFLEKKAQSIVDRKEKQFRNSKYSKQYKKAYEQYQEQEQEQELYLPQTTEISSFVLQKQIKSIIVHIT